MAIIRDVMPAFDLLQPTSAADAQKLLQEHGDDAWIMAGGLDSFDWLKDRIKKPKVLVDLSGIDELKGIRTTSEGVEIGAMTTLTEIATNPTIKSQYGVTNFIADAWSPPAFMKTNDSAINGGTLCGVPGAICKSGDWRQAYADYLVQYAKDYAAAGVPLSYVGPENETTIAPPQDSMIMSPEQTADFMGILGATLARSGLSTRAECCASISWNYAQQFAAAIKTDKAANTATALFTSHGYFVAPGSPLRGWSKPVWETEWAPFGFQPWDPAWDDGSLSSGFTWAQNIYTGLTAANLGAFLYLWGASTSGLTGPNTGLVEVNGNTVATSGRLWAFASYSRFIRPGAVRIGTTTSATGLEVAAFRNSNGSIAVIVLNKSHSRQVATFSLRGLGAAHVTPYLTDTSHQLSAQSPITVTDSAFTATRPPRALVTYDMRGR